MNGEPDFSDMDTCDWCGGYFLPEDMSGEHCRECAANLLDGMS